MRQMIKSRLAVLAVVLSAVALAMAVFSIFFDEAVLVRKPYIYHVENPRKVVALTFDDGPSARWTPPILDALKQSGIKATFFMLGEHVARYPEVAKRVAAEGHEIGNHTYDHHVLIYYTLDELEREIKDTEKIIRESTGVTTRYFRPPKAWLTPKENKKIEGLGYKVILWSLNSKDWVNFDDRYIVRYLCRHIRPGDIILFHDSGGAFGTEGGKRKETLKCIPLLAEKLRRMGYSFVTVSELLEERSGHDKAP